MTPYRTFGDLASQVKQELDIEVEEFIQPSELITYFNSAINVVEAELMKIGQKDEYLKGEAFVSLVQGTNNYDLPADIVYSKIRKIIYRESNTIIYEVKKMVEERKYETEDILRVYNTTDYYRYDLYQNGENWQIRIVPNVVRDVTNALRIIYWKDLNRYTADATTCNVPSICYEYIMSYLRYRCYMKETHVNTPGEKENMSMLLQAMRETLQNQVEDPDMTKNDLDLSIYEEMS